MVAAACALRMPDEFAVIAFGRDVATLRDLHEDSPGEVVVDRVLRLVGHGETGLSRALACAGEVLTSSSASRRVVLLLSDCRATGPDEGRGERDSVLQAAAALDELIILAPADDGEQAHDLAKRAGARCADLHSAEDAPAALTQLPTASA